MLADGSPLINAAPVPATPSAADAGIEALRRLNRSAPAPLVSLARKARLVSERKPVTAVFADECFEGSMEMGAMACAAVSGMVLGGSQMAMGETDAARDSLERSLDYASQSYMAPMRLRGRVLLASIDGADGKIQRAEDGFRSALSGYVSMGGASRQAEARLARRKRVWHADGCWQPIPTEMPNAHSRISTRLWRRSRHCKSRPALARAYRARGVALARMGQADEANRSLELSASMATKMGLMDGPWPQVITELAAVPTGASPIKLVN